MPDAWLICPRDAEALVELARAGCPPEIGPGQACVVWLDDMRRGELAEPSEAYRRAEERQALDPARLMR